MSLEDKAWKSPTFIKNMKPPFAYSTWNDSEEVVSLLDALEERIMLIAGFKVIERQLEDELNTYKDFVKRNYQKEFNDYLKRTE